MGLGFMPTCMGREGDQSNAAYWYRRTGKPVCRESLDEEWNGHKQLFAAMPTPRLSESWNQDVAQIASRGFLARRLLTTPLSDMLFGPYGLGSRGGYTKLEALLVVRI
jgi:hypothetical protein